MGGSPGEHQRVVEAILSIFASIFGHSSHGQTKGIQGLYPSYSQSVCVGQLLPQHNHGRKSAN